METAGGAALRSIEKMSSGVHIRRFVRKGNIMCARGRTGAMVGKKRG